MWCILLLVPICSVLLCVCLLGHFCECFAWWKNARIDRANDTVSVVARQKLDHCKERPFVTRTKSTHAAAVRKRLFATRHLSEGGIVCSSVCVFVCLVCLTTSLSVNMITPKPLEISQSFHFSWHRPVVKWADKFENGYIGLRGWIGWCFNVSDVPVIFCFSLMFRCVLLCYRLISNLQGGPIKTAHFLRYHIVAATTDIITRFLLKCSEITAENNKRQFF